MPKLSCRRSRRSAPVTQYNSAAFVQTHQKSRTNSSRRLFKGTDPLVRCLNVLNRSWYRLFTIWAEVERLKISIFDMWSEEKLVGAADKSTKWPTIQLSSTNSTPRGVQKFWLGWVLGGGTTRKSPPQCRHPPPYHHTMSEDFAHATTMNCILCTTELF